MRQANVGIQDDPPKATPRRIGTLGALGILVILSGCLATAPPRKPAPVPVPLPKPLEVLYAGTAPALDDAGTCAAHVLVPGVGDSLTIRWTWRGGSRSLRAKRGARFTLGVPASAETLRVWPERNGAAGCETTLVLR